MPRATLPMINIILEYRSAQTK